MCKRLVAVAIMAATLAVTGGVAGANHDGSKHGKALADCIDGPGSLYGCME